MKTFFGKALFGTCASRRAIADERLGAKLWLGAAIAILGTAILAAMIVGRAYETFGQARQNVHDVQNYRLVLEAANHIAAERGPANAVMAEEPSSTSPSALRLIEFRARTDAALQRIAVPKLAPLGVIESSIPPDLLARVRRQLALARTEVDRVGDTPLRQLRAEDMQSAIEAMFVAADLFTDVVRWQGDQLIRSDPDLVSPVLTGMVLGNLRDYGGRLASHLMAPVAVEQVMPISNLIESRSTRGRLLELWSLLQARSASFDRIPAIAAGMREIDQRFFDDGLKLVDGLIAESRNARPYSLTATEFTERYVEAMKPLERLRTSFLDATIDNVIRTRDEAQRALVTASLVSVVVLLVVTGLVISVQTHLLRPLLRACDEVIGLAEDRSVAADRGVEQAKEMRRLFDAIDILKIKLKERAFLTQQLKLQAETDGLTGLTNRRALDRIGEGAVLSRRREEAPCLILMDIDHFKAINDTYGHPTGDHVLREIAGLARAILRSSDVVARFGGEEFAILVGGQPLSSTVALAEKIRLSVQDHEILAPDGRRIPVTASFGVADGTQSWPDLIARADAALYRAKGHGRNCVRHDQAAPVDHPGAETL
jgi:diguanylate cyclase (GGDEF)-like protein